MKKQYALMTIVVLWAQAAAAATTVRIVEGRQIVGGSVGEWSFEVPPFSVEHQVRLSLEVRTDFPRLAGSNHWVRVAVNGTYMALPNLLNKRNEFKLHSGLDLLWVKGDRWRVLYSPDFKAAIDQKDNGYACPDADPYRFVWDITQCVRPGKNTLRVQALKVSAKPLTLVLRNIEVEVGAAILPPAAEQVAPAPTGPLPTFVAKGPQSVQMQAKLSGHGGIELVVAGKRIEILTRTSLPAGQWCEAKPGRAALPIELGKTTTAKWVAGSIGIERRASLRSDHLRVADTITNLGNKLVGVIIEHRVPMSEKPVEIRIAGRPAYSASTSALNACHPTAFAQWRELGLGLVAEDDVFRVQVRSSCEPGWLVLSDNKLGIEPGKSVTLEWSVYPAPKGDYWDFVNAVRRDWDTNFTIPGPFCFMGGYRGKGWSAKQWGEWVRRRGLKIVCGGIAKYANGKYAHGTGILHAPEWVQREKNWVRKIRIAAPEVTTCAYFHAQCCTEPGGEEKYADSYLIDAKGEHLGYPYRYPIPLYLPTRDNSYGKALWGVVRTLLDTVGVDGIYWDEMTHSVLRFADHAPWDGYTVKIDPKTHELRGKWTSVTLLTQPLRLDIVRYIRGCGKFLMANTQPATRTMTQQKIVRFVETGTYSAVLNTNLGCPIGLGNHHPEKTQADAALNVRRILEFGGVYYGHMYYRDPAAWNFTDVMFPITPVELHEGVVFGEERIHTARSGRFGWPDGAAASVYVVDAKGARASASMVKEVEENGRRLYEIRMPGDHFAVLVKKRVAR